MAGPPVYEDELFELSIDPSYNSLDNTFKGTVSRDFLDSIFFINLLLLVLLEVP
jgi:hypothetical protein